MCTIFRCGCAMTVWQATWSSLILPFVLVLLLACCIVWLIRPIHRVLLSLYLFAMMTQRVLLLDWAKPFPVDNIFQSPSGLNWDAKPPKGAFLPLLSIMQWVRCSCSPRGLRRSQPSRASPTPHPFLGLPDQQRPIHWAIGNAVSAFLDLSLLMSFSVVRRLQRDREVGRLCRKRMHRALLCVGPSVCQGGCMLFRRSCLLETALRRNPVMFAPTPHPFFSAFACPQQGDPSFCAASASSGHPRRGGLHAGSWTGHGPATSLHDVFARTQVVRRVVTVSVLSVPLIAEVQPGLNWRIKMHSFQNVECITSLVLILHIFISINFNCHSNFNLSIRFGPQPPPPPGCLAFFCSRVYARAVRTCESGCRPQNPFAFEVGGSQRGT